MTNYYSQACCTLEYDTEEERSWLETELGKATQTLCVVCEKDPGACECREGFQWEGDAGNFIFYKSRATEEETGRYAFIIEGEESFDMSPLADVVERFQKKFDKEDFWQCQLAYVANRCVPDAFGGAGVHIHKGKSYWFVPGCDMTDKWQELENLEQLEQTLAIL